MIAVPWRFGNDDPWAAVVAAAPSEDHKRAYFEAAVPVLATRGRPAVTRPLIIAGHITAVAWGRPPAGPAGRAKAFLDALHDDRRSGPKYSDTGAAAPLNDDSPGHPGNPKTQYLIGARLRVAGQLLAEVPVKCEAPNNIAGTVPNRRGSPLAGSPSAQRYE